MELRSEHLVFRHWDESDAEALYSIAKDPELAHASGWAPHESVEYSRGIIRHYLIQDECYAILLDGRVIGCIEIYDHHRSNLGLVEGECECSGWTISDYWNTPIFTEMPYTFIGRALFDLGYKRAFIPVYKGERFTEKALAIGLEYLPAMECPEFCSDNMRQGYIFIVTPDDWHRIFDANKH